MPDQTTAISAESESPETLRQQLAKLQQQYAVATQQLAHYQRIAECRNGDPRYYWGCGGRYPGGRRVVASCAGSKTAWGVGDYHWHRPGNCANAGWFRARSSGYHYA